MTLSISPSFFCREASLYLEVYTLFQLQAKPKAETMSDGEVVEVLMTLTFY